MMPAEGAHKGGKNRRRRKPKKNRSVAVAPTTLNESHSEDMTERQAEKRSYNEGDNQDSSEEQVVKKKKKNKPLPAEPGKKGAKSIRQMKREKYQERLALAETHAKDAIKEQCMQYLSQWKHDKTNWKFMKAKQVWLYKNKFSVKLVPEESWSTFLEYFSSAQGNIKKMLLDDANKIIEKHDTSIEKEKNENEDEPAESTPVEKPDEVSYRRARDLIQHLEE